MLITKGTIVHREKTLKRRRDLIVNITRIAIIIDPIAMILHHIVVDLVTVMKDTQGIGLEVFLVDLFVNKHSIPILLDTSQNSSNQVCVLINDQSQPSYRVGLAKTVHTDLRTIQSVFQPIHYTLLPLLPFPTVMNVYSYIPDTSLRLESSHRYCIQSSR